MKSTQPLTRNPLHSLARAAPPVLGPRLSLFGRLIGVLGFGYVLVSQDFARTRGVTAALLVLTLVSLLPLGPRWVARFAWSGAGIVFFGGVLLAHLAVGWVLIVAGLLAGLSAALSDVHAPRPLGVAGFFTGFGLTSVIVVLVVLGIEG